MHTDMAMCCLLLQAYKESISKARSHPPVERYPFVYAKQEGYKPDGWAVYDEDEENARLGVPNSKWRISTANKDYSLCPTLVSWHLFSSFVCGGGVGC